ncbi:uncharacterized protein CEXT_135231 [Caerostris extrusa]|uniref:Uncharacterized protein n=1 Tax=Caerostris extrusa TaxID=172846 RepID=A0AAV4P0P7_CAEEX|nr:uncharacterized protein CEXT_135231 [Caerostris extrusa]
MANRMSPNSLYTLCLEEAAFHLQEKYWNRENTNPFSQVNCNIVNDLFQFLVHELDLEMPSPLELLLKSGQLQDLVLDEVDLTEKQWKSLMTILLEEADSCRNIRYFWNESVDTLANLQNLETFDIFCYRNSYSYYPLIAEMLQNHPKLVSLGDTDSSWVAHHIHTTCRMDIVPRFGLKECFWGFNGHVEKFKESPIAYNQQFPEYVKSSVVLFPLVEKLLIEVHHEDCMQYLKKLKHLRVLEINFNLCYGLSARTAFISLLSEIGPQLKRLVIVGRTSMPVDVIMKYCSNVVSLELRCNTIVQGESKLIPTILDSWKS